MTCGKKHKTLKTIYAGSIPQLIIYGSPFWKVFLEFTIFKSKKNRLYILNNIRISMVYRTVLKEDLFVKTVLIPIDLVIEETAK